jgi:cyclopropane fatty-acyl-phospholipid synthase-like methyltransferase
LAIRQFLSDKLSSMLFNSPLSVGKANHLIQQLHLRPGSRVLDVGCGDGEFLVRVAERYGAEGLGLDLDGAAIERARKNAGQRAGAAVNFAVHDAARFEGEKESYDLIVCIGAEFIFGGYEGALRTLRTWLAPDGSLLIGTIYWKQEPAPEYLQLLGGENLYFDHHKTVELAMQQGFVPLYICRSSDDEWDDFESQFSARKYQEALRLPPGEAKERIAKIKEWQMGYLKWGVHTMGFGFYLLRRS